MKGQKRKGFLVFFFFLTKGFYFLADSWLAGAPLQAITDFALLYLLTALFINRGNLKFYKCLLPNYKWILVLFVYITLEFVFTLLLGREQFGYSLKMYRLYIPLLSFFLIQELDLESIKYVVKRICALVMFSVVVHSLQALFGVQLLFFASVLDSGTGTLRYANIPELCYFVLIYLSVTLSVADWKNIVLLFVCMTSLVLSQHRGPMISYVMVMTLYVIMARSGKKIIGYGMVAIIVLLFAGNYISNRFVGSDTGSDIKTVFSMSPSKSNTPADKHEMGTFTFRVLLLTERAAYLIDNPKYLLTGVGVRHEDSPRTKEFDFKLGTAYSDETGNEQLLQIISCDLAWLTPLMLFGVIGIFLFLKFTFKNIKYLFAFRCSSDIFMSAFLYYIFLFLTSLKNDFIFGMQHITFMVLIIELARKSNGEIAEFKLFNK